MKKKKKTRGIFCLEGDWWNDFKRPTSVEPLLKVVDQYYSDGVRYIHKDVHTREEFDYLLSKKWCNQKYSSHPIAYLGFHGEPGVIRIGDMRHRDSRVSLEDIAELLKGKCKGKIFYFASCQTLDVDGRRLRQFLERTGARAVCGYQESIDWVAGAAFELLLLTRLHDRPLTEKGISRLRADIRKEAGSLWTKLSFRFAIPPMRSRP